MKKSIWDYFKNHTKSFRGFLRRRFYPLAKGYVYLAVFANVIYTISYTWPGTEGRDFLFRVWALIYLGVRTGLIVFIWSVFTMLFYAVASILLGYPICFITAVVCYFRQTNTPIPIVSVSASSTSSAVNTPTPPPKAPQQSTSAGCPAVRTVVQDTVSTIQTIDQQIKPIADGLGITWPSLAKQFEDSIDIQKLARKSIQQTNDKKNEAITAANTDLRELQAAFQRWNHIRGLLRVIRNELYEVNAPQAKRDELGEHTRIFLNLNKINLPKREWDMHRNSFAALPDMIRPMSPYLQAPRVLHAARVLGFNDIGDVDAISLKNNYRRLSRMTHPDINQDPNASEMYSQVEQANTRLRNYLQHKGTAL